MKGRRLTLVRERPVCRFCGRHGFVVRWEDGSKHIWACLRHTRRAWKGMSV